MQNKVSLENNRGHTSNQSCSTVVPGDDGIHTYISKSSLSYSLHSTENMCMRTEKKRSAWCEIGSGEKAGECKRSEERRRAEGSPIHPTNNFLLSPKCTTTTTTTTIRPFFLLLHLPYPPHMEEVMKRM